MATVSVRPAPSPSGRNDAQMFLRTSICSKADLAKLALDAAGEGGTGELEKDAGLMSVKEKLEKLLQGKLSSEDMAGISELFSSESPNDTEGDGDLKSFLKAKGLNAEDVAHACSLIDGPAPALDYIPANGLPDSGGMGGRRSGERADREQVRAMDRRVIAMDRVMTKLGNDRRDLVKLFPDAGLIG
jgi:hypothetical protein